MNKLNKFINKLPIFAINLYRNFFSIPLGKMGVQFCIFEPSCSQYGLECFKRFNFFKALYFASYRIIRCNPFSKGGYDPVPEK